MVGVNCSSFGCSKKISGVAISKVPQGNSEWSSNRRKRIISVVTNNRVVDKALKEKIMKKIISSLKDPIS